jgi:streptogramin lyase
MSTLFRLRAVATFVLGVSAAAASGCEGGFAPPSSGEELGELTLALVTVPSDVDCLRVQAKSTTGPQTALRRLSVSTNQPSLFTITGLPLGEIQITTEGFSQACGDIGSTTAPTWVGDTQTVTLVPGYTPAVTITMRRPGHVSLAVDFDATAPPAIIEELALPNGARATRLALAPDGSIVFTARMPGLVGRATYPSTVTALTTIAEPYGVAVAANGDIWVTRSFHPQVARISPAGVVQQLFGLGGALPAVRDIAIDAAGVTWVGASGLSAIARIQGGVVALLNLPTPSVRGIVVGGDGQLRVSLESGSRIGVLTPAGTLAQQIPVGIQPGDIIRGAGTDFWFLAENGSGIGHLIAPAQVPTFALPPAGPEGTLVMRNDGRLWFSEPNLGRVGSMDVDDNSYFSIPLPPGTRPLGLVVDGAGRLWVADGNNPRLLVLLP